jgi:hypothetical protein
VIGANPAYGRPPERGDRTPCSTAIPHGAVPAPPRGRAPPCVASREPGYRLAGLRGSDGSFPRVVHQYKVGTAANQDQSTDSWEMRPMYAVADDLPATLPPLFFPIGRFTCGCGQEARSERKQASPQPFEQVWSGG